MINQAKPFRLYLVENSEIMVRLLRDLLGGDPAVQIVGQSGSAGVAEAEITALAPDAVIVDIALEDSTGFDVLRALSARQPESRPVLMVLSNFVTQPYRDEARRLGADYFFDKSGQIVELLKTVLLLAKGTIKRNGSHR